MTSNAAMSALRHAWYILSLFLGSNRNEIEKFSSTILVISEVTFLLMIPVLTFIIGKIRGKL
jgi:hypothetical protein